MGTTSASRNYLFVGLMCFILILGAFFRFFRITEIPLGLYPDEAMNGSNALEALETGEFKIFYPENNGREGLFINIQALSVWYFGNTPWALRLVSAVFGTLTIWGLYLLTRELFGNSPPQIQNSKFKIQHGNSKSKIFPFSRFTFPVRKNELIALLASFLLAASYWHINFSRIGFRAILVPFLSVFGIYFLMRGLRRGNILDVIWAGMFIGLGFHTYIAFRMMPLVITLPILWFGWKWWKKRKNLQPTSDNLQAKPYCAPCAIALFLLSTFVAALPVGYYFLTHPDDLIGRTGQVSVFAAESPLVEFAKANAQTVGMFFLSGDCNARHNLPCKPELNPIVAFFFAAGVLASGWTLWKTRLRSFPHLFLLWWAAVMSLPATLTREGLPHALRAIGMIPPVFVLAGYGGIALLTAVRGRLASWQERFPMGAAQIGRIAREFTVLFFIVPLVIPLMTYRDYFLRWPSQTDTYFAFATDLYHLGKFLNALPRDTKKYVVVNMGGVEVRGIPMPAQTIMYTTGTFTEMKRRERNMFYLLPDAIDVIHADGGDILITPLNGNDAELRARIKKIFPAFRESAPGDFIVYKNY